jgi:hypothetical protein
VKKQAPPPEPEHKEFAPLWITTFADLVGQLFAFFVMLLVLGKMQQAGMMGAVRESFTSTMKNFGYCGTLYGKDKLAGPHDKPVYAVKDPDQTSERTLDAKESERRRCIKACSSRSRRRQESLRLRRWLTFQRMCILHGAARI